MFKKQILKKALLTHAPEKQSKLCHFGRVVIRSFAIKTAYLSI